jgi:hypothetical protein
VASTSTVDAQAADLGIHASPVCESLLLPLRKRVAIRIPRTLPLRLITAG